MSQQKKPKKSAGLSALLNPESHLHMLEISTIVESPNNPRTQFDQAAIDELAESIKAVGVIQPIVVRNQGDGYELVCGARRFRASQIAGLNQIPAVVRTLTDEEAFELAITENLQRKDVNPLDEAVALLKMKEHGYTTAEMSAKLGKSEKYVVQRLKLNDLIDEFKQVLFAGKVLITHAYLIARISPDDQRSIFIDLYEDWESEDFDPKDVDNLDWNIKRLQRKISDAVFDTTDPKLVPAAGPCSTCPKNSACATLLFPDLASDKAICSDSTCWTSKEVAHFASTLKRIQDGEDILLIYPYYGTPSVHEAIKDAAESIGLDLGKVLKLDEFQRFTKPEAPDAPDPEDYTFDPEADWNDHDSKEEADQAYQEALADHQKDMEEYERDLEKYEQTLATGTFKKGLIVSGSNVGSIVPIQLKNGVKPANDLNSEADPAAAIANEIAGIEAREKRAKELDGEKVHTKLVEAFAEHKALSPDSYQTFQDGFTPNILRVACYMLYQEVGYSNKEEVNKFLGLDDRYTANEKAWEAIKEFAPEYIPAVFNYLIHIASYEKFKSHLPQHAQGQALRFLMEQHLDPLQVEKLQAEIVEKADKRSARAAERIANLQSKLNEIQ